MMETVAMPSLGPAAEGLAGVEVTTLFLLFVSKELSEDESV